MYDLMPPTACFCGCGRSMAFGRVQTINGAGRCLTGDVEVLRAAAQPGEPGEAAASLVADAEPLLEMLRDVVHGDRPEKTLDRSALRAWWQRALPERDRLEAAGAAPSGDRARGAHYTPRQLAALHELGALGEMQVWARFGMAG